MFCAPASEPDPQKRALLVLRWFLAALRRQQYAGRDEKDGVKKPLNAFLGELFLAEWQDGNGETKLISEQVSHHPPITACYLWNDKQGVRVSIIHLDHFPSQAEFGTRLRATPVKASPFPAP